MIRSNFLSQFDISKSTNTYIKGEIVKKKPHQNSYQGERKCSYQGKKIKTKDHFKIYEPNSNENSRILHVNVVWETQPLYCFPMAFLTIFPDKYHT